MHTACLNSRCELNTFNLINNAFDNVLISGNWYIGFPYRRLYTLCLCQCFVTLENKTWQGSCIAVGHVCYFPIFYIPVLYNLPGLVMSSTNRMTFGCLTPNPKPYIYVCVCTIRPACDGVYEWVWTQSWTRLDILDRRILAFYLCIA